MFKNWDIVRYKDHTNEYEVVHTAPLSSDWFMKIKSNNGSIYDTYAKRLELVPKFNPHFNVNDRVKMSYAWEQIYDCSTFLHNIYWTVVQTELDSVTVDWDNASTHWTYFNEQIKKVGTRQALRIWDVFKYDNRTENEYEFWCATDIWDGYVEIRSSWSSMNLWDNWDFKFMDPYKVVTDPADIAAFKSRLDIEIDCNRDMIDKINWEYVDKNVEATLGSGYIKWKNNLDTNTEQMSYDINEDNLKIASEAYFADKKSIKEITEADTYLAWIVDTLDNACDSNKNRLNRLDQLKRDLNNAYANKNHRTVKDILDKLKVIRTNMDEYMLKTTEDIWAIKSKENKFNAEEYFN